MGLDTILKNAYENNIIMSGVSAGAICWFEKVLLIPLKTIKQLFHVLVL